MFRNHSDSETISVEDLLVGDIYRIQTGMIVPADSILIHVGHHKGILVDHDKNDTNLFRKPIIVHE